MSEKEEERSLSIKNLNLDTAEIIKMFIIN